MVLALALAAAACGDDAGDSADPTGDTAADTADGTDALDTGRGTGDGDGGEIDYEAVGLWDDGLCDESLPPLVRLDPDAPPPELVGFYERGVTERRVLFG
jgi:hypothetical protein